jgi:hypothetical protein
MGRQIAVAATLVDENSFLEFVRSTASIKIAETCSPLKETIWVNEFAPNVEYHGVYYLWNTAFDWQPTYGQVNATARGNGGWFYVKNVHSAPAVEFVRTSWQFPRYGRVYWAKDFCAPNGLDYDVAAFSKWYDVLVRWIRRHGNRASASHSHVYFLPDAFATHGQQK